MFIIRNKGYKKINKLFLVLLKLYIKLFKMSNVEVVEGFKPTNTNFADLPLKSLEYTTILKKKLIFFI